MTKLRILMIGLVAAAAMVSASLDVSEAVLLPGLEEGESFSAGVEASDIGLVVGFAEEAGTMKAVRWNLGDEPVAAEGLEPLAGNSYSAAYGVNDDGIAVGESGAMVGDDPDATLVAVYWEGITPVVLPAPAGNVGVYVAHSINNINLIVGESANDNEGGTIAVLWNGASPAAVATSLHQEGWEYSSAYHIHDDGIIVGEAKPDGQQPRGVVWTPDGNDYTVTLLPPAPGDIASTAFGAAVPEGDLNLPSQVVGETTSADGTVRGILWTLNAQGGLTGSETMAADTSAQAINDFGAIVGYTGAAAGEVRAASWSLANLDMHRNLAPVFSQAYALNNVNETVGLQNGRALLLTSLTGPGAMGIFRMGDWYLDTNGNGIWESGIDTFHRFGIPGDVPVVGDWNGDGSQQIGVFRNGTWYLDANANGVYEAGIDTVYRFGITGDVPVVGDWNGDGRAQIGIVRNGHRWYLDTTGDGTWNAQTDTLYSFGTAGDTPITGDWNGDGHTQIGVHRDRTFYLDTSGDGSWNALVDTRYVFGNTGDRPITGDWNSDGRTEIGAVRDRTWYLDQDGNGVWNSDNDATFRFGNSGDIPIIGAW